MDVRSAASRMGWGVGEEIYDWLDQALKDLSRK